MSAAEDKVAAAVTETWAPGDGAWIASQEELAREAERLLSRLRREMNGAVVESMERRGIVYPLSYGVSTADIRAIAARYAPNDPLAKYLYVQPVRELQLSALFIADPARLTLADLPFWATGVACSEVAEYLAFALVGRSPLAWEAFLEWSQRSELLLYCAMMSLLRARALSGGPPHWLRKPVVAAIAAARRSGNPMLLSAAEKLKI
ncbi:MAG: DNA alkylation repair enzyme [Rikenellaceae bacterium]|jgi:hypothetical protein|nr:DNA alkylation repair enzyme [Rikenellaceae bacterium]